MHISVLCNYPEMTSVNETGINDAHSDFVYRFVDCRHSGVDSECNGRKRQSTCDIDFILNF